MGQVVKDLAQIHVLIFKYFARQEVHYNNMQGLYNLQDCITYGDAFNLYKKHNTSSVIAKMLNDLKPQMSKICDIQICLDDNIEMTTLEYRLTMIFFHAILRNLRGDVSIRTASELVDIPETIIKQACQQERLLKSYKLANRIHESGKIYMIKQCSKEMGMTTKQFIYSSAIKKVEHKFNCNIVRSNFWLKYQDYL